MKTFWFLAFGQLLSYASANTVTLVVAPSIQYVDWDTPKKLIRTYAGGSLKKKLNKMFGGRTGTAMGHGLANFNCTDTSGKKHNTWAGMVGSQDGKLYTDAVFKNKEGVGVLIGDFEDGHIQTTEYVHYYLARYKGRRARFEKGEKKERLAPRFLQFSITPEQCDQVAEYYQYYATIALDKAKEREERNKLAEFQKLHYGLLLEPYDLFVQLKQELGQQGLGIEELMSPENSDRDLPRIGGGCTSFASGFLKAAGVYDDFFDQENNFRRTVMASPLLIGGDGRETPIQKIFFGKLGNKWIHPNDRPQELIRINWYDPEAMWRFIENTRRCVGDLDYPCPQHISTWLKTKNAKIHNFTVTARKKKKSGKLKKKIYASTLHGVYFGR